MKIVMGTPPSSELNYESIIKNFIEGNNIRQTGISEKYVDPKLCSILEDYYEAKGEQQNGDINGNKIYNLLFEKVKGKSSVYLEQQLSDLKQLYTKTKQDGEMQKELFLTAVMDLHEKIRKSSHYLDNTSGKNQIKNHIITLNKLEQEISDAKKEMGMLKEFSEGAESGELLNSSMITKIIQKESTEKFGNPTKIQSCLSEIRKNIEYLSSKINGIKMK